MIPRVQKDSQHSLKARRSEIEQRLRTFGLVRGPRLVSRGAPVLNLKESYTHRLCRALSDLGPVLSSFGLYLASRVDLLPAKDCLELGMIPNSGDPTPAEAVVRLLQDDLGRDPEEVFTTFDHTPFESRLLFQSHRAVLTNNKPVIVKVIHPELEQYCPDLELLPLLRAAFVGRGISNLALESAEVDFRHSYELKTNFVNTAKSFEKFSSEAEEHDVLTVPRVYQLLSSARILTIEQLSGISLDQLLSRTQNESRELLAPFGFELRELARVLCEIWLRQALSCRYLPVEPNSANLLVLPGKRIAFTDGPFVSLPPGPQANLFDYLIAAASDDAEQACACLLKELRRTGTSTSDDELRQRFRQAMPFREGGWTSDSDCRSLAEMLFVQWRFTTQCGYQPLGQLPAIYRGLFTIADVSRRIAPQIDPLREGLRDLRLLGGVTQFGDMMAPPELAEQFDKYVAMMVELPRGFDEVLTRAAESHERISSPKNSDEARGGKTSAFLVVLMSLVVVAVAWLPRFSSGSPAGGSWTSRLSLVLLAVVSVLLLRTATARG